MRYAAARSRKWRTQETHSIRTRAYSGVTSKKEKQRELCVSVCKSRRWKRPSTETCALLVNEEQRKEEWKEKGRKAPRRSKGSGRGGERGGGWPRICAFACTCICMGVCVCVHSGKGEGNGAEKVDFDCRVEASTMPQFFRCPLDQRISDCTDVYVLMRACVLGSDERRGQVNAYVGVSPEVRVTGTEGKRGGGCVGKEVHVREERISVVEAQL